MAASKENQTIAKYGQYRRVSLKASQNLNGLMRALEKSLRDFPKVQAAWLPYILRDWGFLDLLSPKAQEHLELAEERLTEFYAALPPFLRLTRKLRASIAWARYEIENELASRTISDISTGGKLP